ncbi:MAG TPA: DUF2177 family protein [Devosia sp.]|nr:DUF2177 family protein [Devosia sp.]
MRYVVAYLVTAIVFLGLDALWLTQVALGMYRRELGALLLDQPNLVVAGLFYLLFVAGIVVLAVAPALNGGSWINALLMGAVLGLVAYGTYDITNLSTLRNWSLTVTLADLAWGTVLSAVAATAGYLAVSWLKL